MYSINGVELMVGDIIKTKTGRGADGYKILGFADSIVAVVRDEVAVEIPDCRTV